VILAAAAFVIGALVVGGVVASRDPAPVASSADAGTPSPIEETPSPSTEPYVNERGGYSVGLPTGWRARGDGPATNLRGPDDEAAVSIGPLDAASLSSASRALLRALREGYEDVEVASRNRQEVAGASARAVAGTAVNRQGARLRFLVIAVRGEGRYFGINVFAPESSDPAQVLPAVQTIVSTFEIARS